MVNVTVYLKCDKNVEVQTDDVYLKDIGSLRCADSEISAKLKAIKVYHFGQKDTNRCVISVTKLIALMEDTCHNISVEVLGEVDVLVEKISVDRIKGWQVWVKIVLVCLVTLFGTAFTIMAYHNDIGIQDVFREVYRIFMGRNPEGVNVLEVSYSIGLAVGIVIFFNHVGRRRITKDPTPIEVAMRNYERDVNDALIETAEREGKEIDS
jgi:stage V sporulation protein AA